MSNLIWKITAESDTPVMWCAYANGVFSLESPVKLTRELLNRAKKDKISIHAITVSVTDEGTTVTLMGTEQA